MNFIKIKEMKYNKIDSEEMNEIKKYFDNLFDFESGSKQNNCYSLENIIILKNFEKLKKDDKFDAVSIYFELTYVNLQFCKDAEYVPEWPPEKEIEIFINSQLLI